MLASPPARRRRRGPQLTPTRLTAALALLLALLAFSPLATRNVALGIYMVLVVVTVFQLRAVRPEPGTWLGRRDVRRGLVIAMVAVCGALVATPPANPTGGAGEFLALVILLMVLNVVLGRATQRIATAVDSAVDERQEMLRNRAHRLAYALLGALGGVAVVCDVASTPTRSWLTSALGGGAVVAGAELLFVLPAMMLAWLEPARFPLDAGAGARRSRRARVAAGLLGLTLALPLLLSVAVVVAPEQVSRSSVALPASGGGGDTTSACREFFASRTVGVLVSAHVPLHAQACWDGHRATESFGMNSSDCLPVSTTFTSVQATVCRRETSADGALSFTFQARVSPMLLPFLHRDVTMHLRIDRNGGVEEFP